MTKETAARRRTALRLALAGVAVFGVGAAFTTAAWTDGAVFSVTASASTFDLQARQSATEEWEDVGAPGSSDTVPIVLDSAELAALSPDETIDVPFELCDAGDAGSIASISAPVIEGDLAVSAAGTITATVTAPLIDAALPSDPACAAPIAGNLRVVTTPEFPPEAQGDAGTITFTVTGSSD
ncbi:hypothetical protein [Agromyces sp. Marseille-Q5079]|uniref:hypothetical protein n=1 Tax=Agromyces sp. Marseille-Q5079 TaxID=3439059 RepID=UPI003D9C8747